MAERAAGFAGLYEDEEQAAMKERQRQAASAAAGIANTNKLARQDEEVDQAERPEDYYGPSHDLTERDVTGARLQHEKDQLKLPQFLRTRYQEPRGLGAGGPYLEDMFPKKVKPPEHDGNFYGGNQLKDLYNSPIRPATDPQQAEYHRGMMSLPEDLQKAGIREVSNVEQLQGDVRRGAAVAAATALGAPMGAATLGYGAWGAGAGAVGGGGLALNEIYGAAGRREGAAGLGPLINPQLEETFGTKGDAQAKKMAEDMVKAGIKPPQALLDAAADKPGRAYGGAAPAPATAQTQAEAATGEAPYTGVGIDRSWLAKQPRGKEMLAAYPMPQREPTWKSFATKEEYLADLKRQREPTDLELAAQRAKDWGVKVPEVPAGGDEKAVVKAVNDQVRARREILKEAGKGLESGLRVGALDEFYQGLKPENAGKRWQDDPMYQTVEGLQKLATGAKFQQVGDRYAGNRERTDELTTLNNLYRSQDLSPAEVSDILSSPRNIVDKIEAVQRDKLQKKMNAELRARDISNRAASLTLTGVEAQAKREEAYKELPAEAQAAASQYANALLNLPPQPPLGAGTGTAAGRDYENKRKAVDDLRKNLAAMRVSEEAIDYVVNKTSESAIRKFKLD